MLKLGVGTAGPGAAFAASTEMNWADVNLAHPPVDHEREIFATEVANRLSFVIDDVDVDGNNVNG